MKCPKCSAEMREVSSYQMAPFGGYICPDCGLKISKKTLSKVSAETNKK